MAKRKGFKPVLKKMIAFGLQPFLMCPAVVELWHGGGKMVFDSPRGAEGFVTSLSQGTYFVHGCLSFLFLIFFFLYALRQTSVLLFILLFFWRDCASGWIGIWDACWGLHVTGSVVLLVFLFRWTWC